MIFARAGMGYMAVWDQGGVEVSIDHIRRRGGELHGEVVVSSAMTKGHLHRASFNLSSSTARDRLGKMLIERSASNGSIPWTNMLEDFCTAVLEEERRGTPIIDVGQLPPSPAPLYLIDGFLPLGKTTILYAAGGTGKSYIACLAAVCVATGHSMLGWQSKPGSVLYLDWETDGIEVDERVKRVAAGLGVPAPAIGYRACAAPLEDMAEQLARSVADRQIMLVVVDSIGMASGTAREGGDANESALRLFGALRYLNTTVLAIDHITGEDVKSDKAVAKPYGSIYKVNLARSVWELRRAPGADEETHLAMFHRKVNKGSLRSPVGIVVHHGEHSVSFSTEEIEDESLVVALGNTPRIQRALTAGPLEVKDISEATGIGEAVIRTTLNRGRESQFVKIPDGRWALVVRTETAFRNSYADPVGRVA